MPAAQDPEAAMSTWVHKGLAMSWPFLALSVVILLTLQNGNDINVTSDTGPAIEIEMDGQKPWDVDEARKIEHMMKLRHHMNGARANHSVNSTTKGRWQKTGTSPKHVPSRIKTFAGTSAHSGLAKLKKDMGLQYVSSNHTRLRKFMYYEIPSREEYEKHKPPNGDFAHSMLNRAIPGAVHVRTEPPPPVVKGARRMPLIVLTIALTGADWFTHVLNAQPTVHLADEIVTANYDKDSKVTQLETKLTKALTMPYKSKGLGPSKSTNVSNLDVLGFQLNARKAPFVDLKRIAQAAPRPASIVVFTRSNLVRFAIALWRDRLAKDKSRCEREIGRNATTLKKIPKKTKTSETTHRQLKKNKDKKQTAETSAAPASDAASVSSPAATLKLPKAPKNTTKKSKTSSFFMSPKKKETCEEPGKAKLPVPEFEAWLRDAFWKIGTLTGVAVAAETDYYEVTYEDAHRNRDAMTRDLMDYLGKRSAYQRVRQEDLGGLADPAAIEFDDLRDVLTNYDEIKLYLNRTAPCLAPQLQASRSVSFAPCPSPFHFTDGELENALLKGKMTAIPPPVAKNTARTKASKTTKEAGKATKTAKEGGKTGKVGGAGAGKKAKAAPETAAAAAISNEATLRARE